MPSAKLSNAERRGWLLYHSLLQLSELSLENPAFKHRRRRSIMAPCRVSGLGDARNSLSVSRQAGRCAAKWRELSIPSKIPENHLTPFLWHRIGRARIVIDV